MIQKKSENKRLTMLQVSTISRIKKKSCYIRHQPIDSNFVCGLCNGPVVRIPLPDIIPADAELAGKTNRVDAPYSTFGATRNQNATRV